MARPKSFEEEEALQAAGELFWKQGFDATSMCDLEAGMGMGRQSIYNAFGDKHELFVKALGRYAADNEKRITESLHAPGAGLDAIRDYFRGTVDFLVDSSGRKGCFVVNSILEFGTTDEAVANQCLGNQNNVLQGLENALSNAVTAGELPADLSVSITARMLGAQIYGLTVLSKTGMSRNELEQAVEALLERLG